MIVTLINPPIIDRKYNFTYSVDVPLGLAYVASYLLKKKIDVKVIDAVGEGINKRRKYKKNYTILGLSNEEIINRIDKESKLIAIAAKYSTQHNIIVKLIKDIKSKLKIPIAVGGNHATYNSKELLKAGADYVIFGEGEISLYKLCASLDKKKKKIKNKTLKYSFVKNINELPFPARELFPLDNYFKEKSGFGPTNKRYTSITSSRGCPNNCSYCSSAVFWQRMWRPRNAKNVVDEIQECVEKFGIKEFHFVDDNLTLSKKRIIDICNEIINRKLNINWGATNGIRPENIDYGLLKLMKKSGCNQITLAPESGSQRVLKEIFNKSIDLGKILDIVGWCNKLGIRTTAYIVIGAIGETEKDRMLTESYIVKLAKKGVDEIGAFALMPYPECPITEKYKHIKEIRNWEELVTGIVPKWYPDSEKVKKFKRKIYISFLLTQAIYHPSKVFRLIKNFVLRKQETKTDRALKNMFRTFLKLSSS